MAKPHVPPEYGQAFLHCRTFGHTWHIGEQGPDIKTGTYLFSLHCEVCRSSRIDRLNRRTGALINRRYEYHKGYEDKRHEGQVRRTIYRIEFIKRIEHD
jgi:hypothetical protein